MATRRYGTSRGEATMSGVAVTEAVGSATVADNVEVTVDLASGITRQEVHKALNRIADHVIKNSWPPA